VLFKLLPSFLTHSKKWASNFYICISIAYLFLNYQLLKTVKYPDGFKAILMSDWEAILSQV
jgi:hypothetical protein